MCWLACAGFTEMFNHVHPVPPSGLLVHVYVAELVVEPPFLALGHALGRGSHLRLWFLLLVPILVLKWGLRYYGS